MSESPTKEVCVALNYTDLYKKPVDVAFIKDIGVTIVLAPKGVHPVEPSLMGISHRYNIVVNVRIVHPATPGIYFAKKLGDRSVGDPDRGHHLD